jgi:hypothetical protein
MVVVWEGFDAVEVTVLVSVVAGWVAVVVVVSVRVVVVVVVVVTVVVVSVVVAALAPPETAKPSAQNRRASATDLRGTTIRCETTYGGWPLQPLFPRLSGKSVATA